MPGLLSAITGSGLGVPVTPDANSFTSGVLPWSQAVPNSNYLAPFSAGPTPVVNSAFFLSVDINPNLWDKLVDYRLLVMDVSQNPPQVVGGAKPDPVTVHPVGYSILFFRPMDSSWQFNFPISPSQLSITDAYSINTSATLRGILEEHSGVRFKNVTIQGSFGVWPGRQSVVNPPGTPNILQSVFGGTIAGAQNVATQFTSVINNITNGSNAAKPITLRPDNTVPNEKITPSGPILTAESQGQGTGYYQTMVLTQFLEQYAEAKRNPANASWRLVLDIPKQNQSFVVTPVGFTWTENINKPMEINYNIQFKAWRRIQLLSAAPVTASYNVTRLGPGALQIILNTISAAQNTAAAATSLIGSVRSDVNNILNIVRQTGIFVKQLAGVALAASDLPAQLVSDIKSTVSNFLSTISKNSLFGAAKTDPDTQALLGGIQGLAHVREGLSSSAVANGQLGPNAAASQTLNPSNTAFTNPLQNPLLFSQVPVNSLTLNSAQQNALQNEINTVNSFTVQDLKNMRATILTLCTQLSNSFGAGNAYYSTLFNQPAPIVRSEPMTLDEYDILETFYKLVQAYDVLTATNQLDNDQILNSMEYVNALATTSSIQFSIPNSKIQVPVPFGLTIEQIAMRYLGDPQRWLEIATLNFLREPYIDENGFVLSLLSNADGRNIVVNSSEDLFVGQTVYLNSATQTATARTILNIAPLSQTSFLLTLDGLANLDGFTVSDRAYIQAYLPGTTNSQQAIWMPSDLQTTVDDQINIPSSVANVDLVGLSKVDWLLDPYGDLAVTNTGDFRLAAGLPNLMQALTIKFGTTLGTSLLNPDFGLGVKSGTMVSDTSASNIYNEIENLVIADPRFSGITGLQVTLTPPSLGISLGVQLAGQNGVFPVSYNLPTSQL